MALILRIVTILATALVILYAVGVLVDLVSTWIFLRHPKILAAMVPSQDESVDILLRHVNPRRRLQSIANIVLLPAMAIRWPYGFLDYQVLRVRKNNLQYSARRQLRSDPLTLALQGLSAVLVLGTFGYLGLVWEPLLMSVVAFILVAIVLKHASYLPGSLLESLRRSLSNPFLVMVAIALIDAVALSCSLAVLKAYRGNSTVRLPLVVESAAGLFDVPGNVKDLTELSVYQVPVAVVGLIYSAALIRSVASFQGFKRTDEDIYSIANALVNTEQYKKAEKWVSEGRVPTPGSFFLRARILFTKNDFEKGFDYIRRGREMLGLDTSTDGVVSETVDILALTPLPDSTHLALARYLSNGMYSDVYVSMILEYQLNRIRDVERFLTTVKPLYLENRYPITRAVLYLGEGHHAEARDILKHALTGPAFDEIFRVLREYFYTLISDDLTDSEVRAFIAESGLRPFQLVRDLEGDLGDAQRVAATASLLLVEGVLKALMDEDPGIAIDLRFIDQVARDVARSEEEYQRRRAIADDSLLGLLE